MHSSLVRIQNVFGFFTTVAFALGAVIALSVVITYQNPTADLELRSVQVVKGRPHYYSTKKEEYAHIKFDLDADLSSLFTWNTKQLFVYVTATFPSKNTSSSASSSPESEAIIWDAIIPSLASPWHQNTYIHPTPKTTKKNTRGLRKSKAGLPYPEGASTGILRLENQKPKYQITTPWSKIGGLEDARLHLKYNVQPWVGALMWSKTGPFGMWSGLQGAVSEVFDLPPVKSGQQQTKAKDDLKTETGGERNRGSPA